MRALQLVAHGRPGTFALHDLPDPEPQPDEVLIRVDACGLNHLDLWLEAGELPIPLPLPRTPGCEIAGTIRRLGAAIEGWAVGQRVAVQSNLFCGQCEFCAQNEESLCLASLLLGVQRDGGFADAVVVPSRALVPLPAGLAPETAAALTLAGSTAMHMLTSQATVRPSSWILIVGGASGVGSAAIQIARRLGARVISTGSTAAKRELALRLGAEHVLDPANPRWPAEVRNLTAKRGVDLVIEHVGGHVLERVFECLARNGTVVTCGATAGRTVELNLWPLFVKQQRLVGSYGRNRADMIKTLEWASRGELQPVIDTIYPLSDAPTAFSRLRQRQVLGKLLLRP